MVDLFICCYRSLDSNDENFVLMSKTLLSCRLFLSLCRSFLQSGSRFPHLVRWKNFCKESKKNISWNLMICKPLPARSVSVLFVTRDNISTFKYHMNRLKVITKKLIWNTSIRKNSRNTSSIFLSFLSHEKFHQISSKLLPRYNIETEVNSVVC